MSSEQKEDGDDAEEAETEGEHFRFRLLCLRRRRHMETIPPRSNQQGEITGQVGEGAEHTY